MNRFTTRVTVLALVGLLAGGVAFAIHIDDALVVGYGVTYRIDTLGLSPDPNFEFKLAGSVDDYNSFAVTLKGEDQNAPPFNLNVSKALWSTSLLDTLGIMGTGVDVTLNAGIFEAASPGYGLVTKKEEEGAFGAAYELKGLEIEALLDGGIGLEVALSADLSSGFVGGSVDIDPVKAELFYSVAGGESLAASNGDIGGGLEVALPLGGIDLGIGGELNFDMDAANANPLAFGVGARGDLDMAGFGAAIHFAGGALDLAAIEANVDLMDGVAVEAYVGLDLLPTWDHDGNTATPEVAREILDHLEITVILGDGSPIKWWVGFAMVGPLGVTGDKNAPSSPEKNASSVYLKAEFKV